MSERTQACTVCGYERQFVEMGSKKGKDGRIARWPIFEICPRKDNPTYHESALQRDYLAIDPDAPVMEVEMRILAIGWIWSCHPHNPMDGIALGLEEFERVYHRMPSSIAINSEQAEGYSEIEWETAWGETVDIPIRTDLVVLPHDIYFILEA